MLDAALLQKLAEEDDWPDFVCPYCGGAFFSRDGEAYECDTITDSLQCRWKGPASECLQPSRAVLATEILKLRDVLTRMLPHVVTAGAIMQAEETPAAEATAKLIDEAFKLLERPT